MSMRLSDLPTPCLVLDKRRLLNNIAQMKSRIAKHAVRLRPHMKTCKSADIAKLLLDENNNGITVSTLREAEHFLDHGITDILYAVSITPSKLAQVQVLIQRGAKMTIILDHIDSAIAVTEFAQANQATFNVMIEVDTDGHRAGIAANESRLIDVARVLHDSEHINFCGVMTHAGSSYNCASVEEIIQVAENERAGAVACAVAIRAAGIACPEVSIGSTPTVTFAKSLQGVTEVRAGVFVFQDLFQFGLGVCAIEDIALSVLTSVITQIPAHNRLITDAGGLALSKDHSTQSQTVDCGYGLLCAEKSGALIENLIVQSANQEHGLITSRSGSLAFDQYKIGSRLRVLPNHACMTAAAHDSYFVVDGGDEVVAQWSRCNGW